MNKPLQDAHRIIAEEHGHPVDVARRLASLQTGWVTEPPLGLEHAIVMFKQTLPGWWYSVCECQVSCDASCAPTVESTDIALVEHNNPFDSGFHVNLAQPSSLAAALLNVMNQALEAKAKLAA